MPLPILLLNQISQRGSVEAAGRTLPTSAETRSDPVAILLRSADLHRYEIPASVRAVGRAGAGTNNIPLEALSARGIPVFNTPGGNANAVKELVLAGMLMAARNLAPALAFSAALDPAAARSGTAGRGRQEGLSPATNCRARHWASSDWAASAACWPMPPSSSACRCWGYDPEITVDAAWSLPAQVRRAASVAEVLRGAHFVSLHVPLVTATRGLINEHNIGLMRPGAVLLNFSRDGVVDDAALLSALNAAGGTGLGHYVCDFPSSRLHGHPRVVALPHLGASTREAEDNCAVMVAEQLRAYLEHGEISNAVNFPAVMLPRESDWRVAIANANVPNMLGQISTAMAAAGLNIRTMVNRSRGEMAYTLVDIDSAVSQAVLQKLRSIEGVLAVNDLPLGG